MKNIINEYIRRTAQSQGGQLGAMVRKVRLKWFEHVLRSDEEHVGRMEMELLSRKKI